jgi:hypothetical protein
MKNLKFIFGSIVVIMATVFIYSCAKDSVSTVQNQESTELRVLNVQMPIVQNGILKFTSKQHLSNFIDETIVMDDDERVLFENSLGFTSLYSTVNTEIAGRDVSNTGGSLNQPLVRNGITLFERSSIYQTVFNQHHELWVGNHIYKYVGENLCIRTTSPYVSEILDIRSNPDKIVRDNTELIDFVRDSVIIVKPRSKCQMIVRNPFEVTGTTGYVQVDLIDLDGVKHTGICGGKVTINWGDGTTSGGPNNSSVLNVWAHQYPTPPLATCITHTVTFTVEFNSSSICSFYNKCSTGSNPLILTGTTTITICNTNTCTPNEHQRDEIRISENFYNNNNNCADFYLGYDLENTWFKEPKAWGRIIHFRKNGSGWKKSKPDHRSEIRIHGTAYRGNCDDFSSQTVEDSDDERAKDFKFVEVLDNAPSGFVADYHLRSDNKLFVDWKVFHLSSSTPLPVTLDYPFYPW